MESKYEYPPGAIRTPEELLASNMEVLYLVHSGHIQRLPGRVRVDGPYSSMDAGGGHHKDNTYWARFGSKNFWSPTNEVVFPHGNYDAFVFTNFWFAYVYGLRKFGKAMRVTDTFFAVD